VRLFVNKSQLKTKRDLMFGNESECGYD
jgi:hypothetical protein